MRMISILLLVFGASTSVVAGTASSAEPPPLEALLDRTAKSVETFWRQFPRVTCTEVVTQEKLGDKGKRIYGEQSTFDYLIFMEMSGDNLTVEESRLAKEQPGKSKNLPLLVTNGFATLALVFHPYYQASFEFERLSDEVIGGKSMIKIGFRHLPGTRSTAALRLKDRDYPLDLKGVAWIDPDSSRIAKISANLVSPMQDMSLRALNSEVMYSAIQFPKSREAYWLPTEATIDVETPHQHWHNIHHFTDYKLFSVQSESVVTP